MNLVVKWVIELRIDKLLQNECLSTALSDDNERTEYVKSLHSSRRSSALKIFKRMYQSFVLLPVTYHIHMIPLCRVFFEHVTFWNTFRFDFPPSFVAQGCRNCIKLNFKWFHQTECILLQMQRCFQLTCVSKPRISSALRTLNRRTCTNPHIRGNVSLSLFHVTLFETPSMPSSPGSLGRGRRDKTGPGVVVVVVKENNKFTNITLPPHRTRIKSNKVATVRSSIGTYVHLTWAWALNRL